MEKKIEDYLHLYLHYNTCGTPKGECVNSNICQARDRCMYPAGIEMYIFPIETFTNGWLEDQLKKHKQLQYSMPLTKTNYVRVIKDGYIPMLRPLSSMTEEEAHQCWNECECRHSFNNAVCNYKYVLTNITRTEVGLTLKSSFLVTRWLLSKGFDIFGLIEAGLAIDSTKLKD